MNNKNRRSNGEGTFERLPNGKMRLRKTVGWTPEGKPIRVGVTGTSKQNCIDLMKNKMREHAFDNVKSNLRNLTIKELCYEHFEADLREKDRLKPKAADRRESTIRNQIAKYPIGKIKAAVFNASDLTNHIEGLISEGNLSVSSIEKTLNVINSAFRWACDQGKFDYNPCTPAMDRLRKRLINLKKREYSLITIAILSDSQIIVFEETLSSIIENDRTNRALMALSARLLLHTGMRSGELCALRWKHWNREDHILTIERTRYVANSREVETSYVANENDVKNSLVRSIRLKHEAQEILEKMYEITPLKKDEDYIFINRNQKPSNPSNYGKNLNEYYKKMGFKKTEVSGAHILRRTFVTKMYYQVKSVEFVAAYVGDTPQTIREHYLCTTKKVVAEGKAINVVEYNYDN